jgi:uncharacterized delta-60 repeat protein
MPDASFNSNVNNGVYTAALQTDGKIIIGGFFSSVNGQARSILSRLNADGTLDASFTLTPDSTVNTSAQQPDGKILIGGIFSNISGVARSRLARLNADGTLDMSFNWRQLRFRQGRSGHRAAAGRENNHRRLSRPLTVRLKPWRALMQTARPIRLLTRTSFPLTNLSKMFGRSPCSQTGKFCSAEVSLALRQSD